MPVIEMQVSEPVWNQWQVFLQTEPAARLKEAGLLGDWVALAFMAQVEHYLKEGLPQGPGMDAQAREDDEAVQARRRLTKQQKRVLPMFNENENQTAAEMSRVLGLSPEQGQTLAGQWVEEGFLETGAPRQGEATYVLSPTWNQINLTANRPSLNAPRLPHLWEEASGRKKAKT
ncbi:MAG: hypothetical protein PVG03_09420 [Desulfarculaceae bacterium]|jgi:hypothetical protein